MIVGVDLRPIEVGVSGGVALLVKGLVEALIRDYPTEQFLVFSTPFNSTLIESTGSNASSFALSPAGFFEELDRVGAEQGMDVLFRSYPVVDTLSFPLKKQIVLIPDAQQEDFPEFFGAEELRMRRLAFDNALVGAGAIATISNFSRESLLRYPGRECDDIFLTYPALLPARTAAVTAELDLEEMSLIPQGPFFFYPANLWPHKNHRRILRAFARYLERTKTDMTVVLTGDPKGWTVLRKEFPSLPVRHLGFVGNSLMQALYVKARALIFFSLYEGFGIPLLEAFHFGTPILCSNTTSLPEVGGDAVLMCDPTDIEAMADLMTKVVADQVLCHELAAKGRMRMNQFTWEKATRSFMEACQRVNSQSTSPAPPDRWLNDPLVSIVVPSYNQGQFLKRTIESVLNQTYRRIELIVIDGGSTDQSVDILRSYGERLSWSSEKDRGQADGINKGFARATGEIFAYLNSDDTLQPTAVETIVAYFREHRDCDLVYGDAEYIDVSDNIIGRYKTAPHTPERLAGECYICQPAAFWTRQMARRVGPFNLDLQYVMDYDYWIRMAQSGAKMRYLPTVLASSRLYPETKTLSARAGIHQEIFRISRQHYNHIHVNWVLGYVHYQLLERIALVRLVVRAIPKGWNLAGHWLHRWQNRTTNLSHLPRRASHVGVGFLGRWWPDLLASAAWTIRRVIPERNLVFGCWSDSWVDQRCVVIYGRRPRHTTFFLKGTAPCDTQLTIIANGHAVGEYSLRGECEEKIEVVLPRQLRYIALKFSRFVRIDPGRSRRVSFRLKETNMFSERDMWQ